MGLPGFTFKASKTGLHIQMQFIFSITFAVAWSSHRRLQIAHTMGQATYMVADGACGSNHMLQLSMCSVDPRSFEAGLQEGRRHLYDPIDPKLGTCVPISTMNILGPPLHP